MIWMPISNSPSMTIGCSPLTKVAVSRPSQANGSRTNALVKIDSRALATLLQMTKVLCSISSQVCSPPPPFHHFSYLIFSGDGITIWGSVENYERGYSVSVDNIGITSYAGSPRAGPTNTTVLAHYANLGFGAHTVTIRNGALVATDMFASSRLEIDYVEVFTKHDALVDLNSQEGSSNECVTFSHQPHIHRY